MKKIKSYEYSRNGIKQNILQQAKSVRLAEGWAETIAENVAKAIDAWIEDKGVITEDELRTRIGEETETYSEDLAFAYRNHDKII